MIIKVGTEAEFDDFKSSLNGKSKVKTAKVKKEKDNKKSKGKAKVLAPVLLAGSLVGVGAGFVSGAMANMQNTNTEGKETPFGSTAITTTVESSEIKEIKTIIDKYQTSLSSIENIIDNVDLEKYHYTQEKASWKYGTIDMLNHFGNIAEYLQGRIDEYSAMIEDGIVSPEELIRFGELRATDAREIHIVEIEDGKTGRENLEYTIRNAMNENKSSVSKSDIEKIFDDLDLYSVYTNIDDMLAHVNGISESKTILDSEIMMLATEDTDITIDADDAINKTTSQGFILKGTEVKQEKKQEKKIEEKKEEERKETLPPPVVSNVTEESATQTPTPVPNVHDEQREMPGPEVITDQAIPDNGEVVDPGKIAPAEDTGTTIVTFKEVEDAINALGGDSYFVNEGSVFAEEAVQQAPSQQGNRVVYEEESEQGPIAPAEEFGD